jgi:hypothetical protein
MPPAIVVKKIVKREPSPTHSLALLPRQVPVNVALRLA